MTDYRNITVDEKALDLLSHIDWKLLKDQKKWLLEKVWNLKESDPDFEPLQGLIHLCDALQDFAVDELDVDENQVFDFETEVVTPE